MIKIVKKYLQDVRDEFKIAEMTNTPEGTLKARFHNALGQLKKLLETAEF